MRFESRVLRRGLKVNHFYLYVPAALKYKTAAIILISLSVHEGTISPRILDTRVSLSKRFVN